MASRTGSYKEQEKDGDRCAPGPLGIPVLKAINFPPLRHKISGHPLHVFWLQTPRKWGKGHTLVGDEVKERHSKCEITVC